MGRERQDRFMASVLIIEDDADLAKLLRETLAASGHDVLHAGDGRKGLDLFRTQRPDIVVTDLFMPGIEGIETIRAIKREMPATKIVAISGGSFLGPAG